jgi:hypothetical protein
MSGDKKNDRASERLSLNLGKRHVTGFHDAQSVSPKRPALSVDASDGRGGNVSDVTCPVCGRVLTPEDASVQCDEARCPMKSQSSVLELLTVQSGVPVRQDGANYKWFGRSIFFGYKRFHRSFGLKSGVAEAGRNS